MRRHDPIVCEWSGAKSCGRPALVLVEVTEGGRVTLSMPSVRASWISEYAMCRRHAHLQGRNYGNVRSVGPIPDDYVPLREWWS